MAPQSLPHVEFTFAGDSIPSGFCDEAYWVIDSSVFPRVHMNLIFQSPRCNREGLAAENIFEVAVKS